MGEMADDLIDQLMDEGHFYGRTKGRKRHRHPQRDQLPVKKKKDAYDEETRAREYPSKKTPAHLLQEYPEKTFDMSFFPTTPKPKEERDPFDPWNTDDAPF